MRRLGGSRSDVAVGRSRLSVLRVHRDSERSPSRLVSDGDIQYRLISGTFRAGDTLGETPFVVRLYRGSPDIRCFFFFSIFFVVFFFVVLFPSFGPQLNDACCWYYIEKSDALGSSLSRGRCAADAVRNSPSVREVSVRPSAEDDQARASQ